MATISQLVVAFLLNSLWQVTLIFAVAQIGSWIMCGTPARFLYRGWAGAMSLAVLLPIVNFLPPLRLFRRSLVASGQSAALFTVHRTSPILGFSWMYPLTGLYFAYLTLRVLQLVRAWSKTRQLQKSAYISKFSPSTLSVIERCRSIFGIKTVSIHSSALVRGPLTVGFWTPQILLPVDVLTTASGDEWTSMLSHEMAHVSRKDFVKNLACEVFCLPISFHPLVALMKSRLAAAREVACDELATDRCIEPEKYVQSLLSMAGTMYRMPSIDCGVGIFDGNILEERVMKLLHRNRLSAVWSRVLLALVLAGLAISSISAAAFALRVGDDKEGPIIGEVEGIERAGKGGVTAPRAIYAPDPEYPKAARAAKQQGEVVVWCVVEADGAVRHVRIVRSLGHDFDESAMTAVRHWKMAPAMKNGKPVAVQINVEVAFRSY